MIYKINKPEIIAKQCYTALVYGRINKKLKSNFSNEESETLIEKVLQETAVENYIKKGKNFYISNKVYGISITINSNNFRIITVDKL